MNNKLLTLLVIYPLSSCAWPNPGTPPALSPIQMSAPIASLPIVSSPGPAATNSLWHPEARSFFEDQRARMVGDILTVNIAIADSAQVNNSTNRSRNNSEDMGISTAFGLEKIVPGIADPAIGVNSKSASQGQGSVNRAESIDLTIAAEITHELQNGNLVIAGRQEVLVNNEVRELTISGIIRPEDIDPDNKIAHTQIAQARISYGGRGDLSIIQRPRYGIRALEKLSPF